MKAIVRQAKKSEDCGWVVALVDESNIEKAWRAYHYKTDAVECRDLYDKNPEACPRFFSFEI